MQKAHRDASMIGRATALYRSWAWWVALASCASGHSSRPADSAAVQTNGVGGMQGTGGPTGPDAPAGNGRPDDPGRPVGVDGAGGGGRASPANIVFVLTDDLSWNLVDHMPNVKKMQQHGATFSNYFVTDSLCCPSRTSMLTGKYPHNSGVFTNAGDDGGYATYLRLGNDPQTFAVALERAGYRTAMLGKFLNGYQPKADPPSMGWTRWDVAGNGYPEFNYNINQDGTLVHHGGTPDDYLTDVLSKMAQDFVAGAGPKPFFIEVATFAPHGPYVPAPRHAALFPNLTYPKTLAFNARPTASDPAWLQALPALTDADATSINNIFRKRAQSVQAVDEMIGALEETLSTVGHARDTYVFFASDNGFHMGERSQRPGKQTAFDTDIRVPLIVTGPGVPEGVTIDRIVQNIDLCPTFTELGHASGPATIDGHSLVPLLRGEPVAGWRNVALIEHHDPKFDPTDPDADRGVIKLPPTYSALRTAGTVYVEYAGGETEFHDHATDPFEITNTAAALTANRAGAFHRAIAAIKACKTDAECWAAQHVQL